MPTELQRIISENVYDYEVFGFTHGGPGFVPQCFRLPLCFDDDDDVMPHTDTLDDKPISFLPIPVDGGGQPLPSQGVQYVSRVQLDNRCKGVMHEGQNIGSQAVDGHGILHTPLPSRLTPSSPSFPFRR